MHKSTWFPLIRVIPSVLCLFVWNAGTARAQSCSDTTFNLSNYSQTIFTDHPADVSIAVSQSSPGNPAPALKIKVTWNTPNVTFQTLVSLINGGCKATPEIVGAIAFSVDRLSTGVNVFFGSQPHNARPLLLQDGKYYVATVIGPQLVEGVYQRISSGGLISTDFQLIDPATGVTDSTKHPDFSIFGKDIFFGIQLRFNHTNATPPGYLDAFFDNLSFQNSLGPAPGGISYGLSNPGTAGPSACTVGDPINCATGNLVETVADLSVRGRGRNLQLTRTYNALGAASAWSSGRFGYGWTDSYDEKILFDAGGNATVQLGNGATVPFTKSGSLYTAPAFVIATLVDNGDGTLTFTLPDQKADVFTADGSLVSQTDPNGHLTTLTRDAGGRLVSVTEPAGRTLSFTYNGDGLVASATDPLGRSVSYSYDAPKNLISMTDPAGAVTHYSYDSRHRMITMTDPNGGLTSNVFDASDRVVSQTDPAGRTTSLSYSGATTTITDGKGSVMTQTYAGTHLISLTRGDGTSDAATWSFSYDAAGNRTSMADPNGHTWIWTYDSRGNALTAVDPLGRTTAFTYDATNHLLTEQDPLGVTTSLSYDGHGNLATLSRPLVGTLQTWTVTSQHSDASHPGDITGIVDATGQVWHRAYDTYGNLIRRTDPLNNAWTGSYNLIGWLTSEVSPRGNAAGANPSNFTTTRQYTSRGDVAQVTDPLAGTTAFVYDDNRNLISATNAKGFMTRYAYDADNELIRLTRPDNSIWTTAYDAAGNMIGQTDGKGKTTAYTYNSLNRRTGMTDPLGRATLYQFDGSGNLVNLKNPALQVTTFSYDAANEMVGISYSDGTTPAVSFTYDADGRRIRMDDGTGTTTYQYDSLNRLVKSTNGAGAEVRYGYNLRQDMVGLTYPSGQQITRSFDAAGRLTSVTDWLGNVNGFSYDADGNWTGAAYGNGMTGVFAYDNADRVSRLQYNRGGGTRLQFDYARDPLGLATSVTSSGAPNTVFSYTSLNQLRSFNALNFAYDEADNPTQLESSLLFFDGANEVTSMAGGVNPTTFAFDSRGSRLSSSNTTGSASYGYDQANRLIRFGSSASYGYNGDGLRMRKSVNGIVNSFVWDSRSGAPLLLQDGDHAFIYGPKGLPIEQINADQSVLYFHADQQGSTRALSDSRGQVIDRYNYDVYGQPQTKTGRTPLLFTAQYFDAESGLQYLRKRYYDPATGEFLTRDPLGSATGHPYLYASGDPLNRVDPTGLDDSFAFAAGDASDEFVFGIGVGPAGPISGVSSSIGNTAAAAVSALGIPGQMSAVQQQAQQVGSQVSQGANEAAQLTQQLFQLQFALILTSDPAQVSAIMQKIQQLSQMLAQIAAQANQTATQTACSIAR